MPDISSFLSVCSAFLCRFFVLPVFFFLNVAPGIHVDKVNLPSVGGKFILSEQALHLNILL